MLLCFYINLRSYLTSFMDFLLMGTQIGGMDLGPHDTAVEWPVRSICSDLADSRLK